MHQTVTAVVTVAPDRVAPIIGDLATYPEWLGLVSDATPTTADDDRPAWFVTIRAKVGPFARSKKLRMVRTGHDQSGDTSSFRFEREETDGRQHSAWTLEASVGAADGGPDSSGPDSTSADDTTAASSRVEMELTYRGGLWTAPLEPILGSFIADAGPQLEAYARRS